MEKSRKNQSRKHYERFPSIDIIRGVAIFMNVFVHIFTDVFNIAPITDNLFGQPMSILLLFVAIGYFGSYGSLFILISGTGNVVSMHKGIQKGKSITTVIKKQIIGGFLLLIFSFLVEGVLQFYGFFGTFFGMNNRPYDPYRAVWHAYTMTPVHCLAVSMIVTGFIQYFLFQNEGHKKYLRNIFIYIILSIIVVGSSQAVWNFIKTIGPEGFPNAHMGEGFPVDYKVYMPPPDAKFGDFFTYFFMAIAAGSNHPIFPYLAMAFAGNIFGILLIKAKTEKDEGKKPNIHTPKYCMYGAIIVFAIGVLLIPILGVDFESIIPVDNVGDITGINNGKSGFWIPWWCFLLAGQIFVVAFLIRIIEYRGKSEDYGKNSSLFRRFGIPAFSIYAWHRFWAIPVVTFFSWLAGNPSWESGSITGTSVDWYWTIIIILGTWAFIHLLLKLWEKIGYIGGIEWMIGTLAGLIGKDYRKSKGTAKENPHWWRLGYIDMDPLFYHPNWIDIYERNGEYIENKRDSKFAKKLSILGMIIWPFSIIAFSITCSSIQLEGENEINEKAKILSLVGIGILVIVVVVLSLFTLQDFGLSF